MTQFQGGRTKEVWVIPARSQFIPGKSRTWWLIFLHNSVSWPYLLFMPPQLKWHQRRGENISVLYNRWSHQPVLEKTIPTETPFSWLSCNFSRQAPISQELKWQNGIRFLLLPTWLPSGKCEKPALSCSSPGWAVGNCHRYKCRYCKTLPPSQMKWGWLNLYLPLAEGQCQPFIFFLINPQIK